MTLEELCVSLEIAVVLKKVGYPQDDTYFVWIKNGLNAPYEIVTCWDINNSTEEIAAAPTSVEIFDEIAKQYDPSIISERCLRDPNRQAIEYIGDEHIDDFLAEAREEIEKGKY